eukprot:gene16186-59560_t
MPLVATCHFPSECDEWADDEEEDFDQLRGCIAGAIRDVAELLGALDALRGAGWFEAEAGLFALSCVAVSSVDADQLLPPFFSLPLPAHWRGALMRAAGMFAWWLDTAPGAPLLPAVLAACGGGL